MVKAVSKMFPLDLMMKSMQFQVKKRLSHKVLKVTVELSSSVGLSAHPSLSAASVRLAR